MIKQAHYQFSPEMKSRYKKDELANDFTIKSRSDTFELLSEISPEIADPSLISSAFGKIGKVLLTLPNYSMDYPSYSTPIESLITKLPSTTEFIVLSHSSSLGKLSALLQRANADTRTQVIEVPDSMRFTVWAEDAYAVTNDSSGNNTYLVEPASFPRAEDALIADIVAAQTDLEHYHASLYYQGGNILIGDNYWLIGADYPNKSLKLGLITPDTGESKIEAVRRSYSASLDKNRKMFTIGSTIPVPTNTSRNTVINGQQWKEELYAGNGTGTVQPMFHIDMFITLAGRNANGDPIALVGDPQLASQILNEPLEQHAMANIYDDIAHKLSSQGFDVIRNPLPLVYQDDPSRRERTWYFATSNNALVEIDGGNKHVWFPTYGYGAWSNLTATDQKNKEIWESLGFTVNMLGDFHPFAYNLGAAHCISKFIERN